MHSKQQEVRLRLSFMLKLYHDWQETIAMLNWCVIEYIHWKRQYNSFDFTVAKLRSVICIHLCLALGHDAPSFGEKRRKLTSSIQSIFRNNPWNEKTILMASRTRSSPRTTVVHKYRVVHTPLFSFSVWLIWGVQEQQHCTVNLKGTFTISDGN